MRVILSLLVVSTILLNAAVVSCRHNKSTKSTLMRLVPAKRDEAPVFGPEFTFTSPKLQPGGLWGDLNELRKAMNAIIEVYAAMCASKAKACRILVSNNVNVHKLPKVTVYYDDGFWFATTPDPKVIEVTMQPRTSQQYHVLATRIQNDVFNQMKVQELVPHLSLGSGHINLGLEKTFMDDDVLLFRNYVVDHFNNPVLDLVFNNGRPDIDNSAPFAMYPDEQKIKFQQIIADVDNNKITTIKDFAKQIEKDVFKQNGHFMLKEKFQALSFLTFALVPEKQRIEHRSIAPQQDFSQFLLQIRFLEGRLDYIRRQSKPIPLRNSKLSSSVYDNLRLFYTVVEETGLDWEKMSKLLPAAWDIPAAKALLKPSVQNYEITPSPKSWKNFLRKWLR